MEEYEKRAMREAGRGHLIADPPYVPDADDREYEPATGLTILRNRDPGDETDREAS